ncbi:MAG: C-GCAxxG-C-C family protein [Bryobacteraceae bacterium]
MSVTDIAEARFQNGHLCSQSVFSALAERWNIGPEVSLRIAAAFGGGIARSAGICGCVTGGIMAIGLAQRGISPETTARSWFVTRSKLWSPLRLPFPAPTDGEFRGRSATTVRA